MSRLSELIQELCPDGVNFYKLGDIATESKEKNKNLSISETRTVTSESKLVKTSDFFDREITSEDISAYKVVKKNMFVYNPSRINIGSIAYSQEEDPVILSPMYIVFSVPQTILLNEFLLHYFKSSMGMHQIISKVEPGARFRLPFKSLAKIKIPLPPIEVQGEIVKTLDNFTELTARLTAELTVRKKQYKYYRDKLLTLDDQTSGTSEVSWRTLGEIAIIKTGTKPHKIEEIGLYEYINAGTTNSGFTGAYNCDGDTVTTPSRGQGGIGFVGYQKEPFWLGPLCYRINSKNNSVCNKFIYYSLCTKTIDLLKLKKEGGIPALNVSDLERLKIAVPPLVEQQRIVSVLDHFDALCNDLTSGLPAEIKARQKQYEYYRNSLLTFKKLN